MLTIQPNFSQNRMHSSLNFGNRKVEDDEFTNNLLAEDEDDFISEKDDDLANTRNNITMAMSDLKDIQNDMPPAAKKVINGLVTLGTAAVAGISMKFGVSETSKALGKVSDSKSVKAATDSVKSSFKKLGKAIGNCYNSIKETKFVKSISKNISKSVEKFNTTNFGKKFNKFFEKILNSKFVTKVKDFSGKAKNIKGAKVVDRTGDVLGAATGVSTAAAGVISPEQKEKVKG